MDTLPHCLSNLITEVPLEYQHKVDRICPPRLFYHERFGLCQCSYACRELHDFCANNCPDYHACLMHNKEELEQSKVTYHRLMSDSITTVPSDTTELETTSSVALPTLSYVKLGLIGISSLFIIILLFLIARCIYLWKRKNRNTVAGMLLRKNKLK